jgi:hypothetical protein
VIAAAEPEPRFARPSVRGVMAALALAVLGTGLWWTVDLLLGLRGESLPVEVTHRPDYVQRALDGER